MLLPPAAARWRWATARSSRAPGGAAPSSAAPRRGGGSWGHGGLGGHGGTRIQSQAGEGIGTRARARAHAHARTGAHAHRHKRARARAEALALMRTRVGVPTHTHPLPFHWGCSSLNKILKKKNKIHLSSPPSYYFFAIRQNNPFRLNFPFSLQAIMQGATAKFASICS